MLLFRCKDFGGLAHCFEDESSGFGLIIYFLFWSITMSDAFKS